MSEDGQDIEALAAEYLRAVDEAEATREKLLAEWAERFYEPGYLDDGEWELLKELLEAGDLDNVEMILEIATSWKVATEAGRGDEFDQEWPAKSEGSR